MRHSKIGMIESRATLDDLAVFVAVAQHASFSEASRRLAVPTSTVSRAVARLEEGLGVSLLRRTSRTVVATSEGRQLVLHAAGHVDGLREALALTAEQHPEPSGLVRVTAPAFTGATRVSKSLASFALAHPKVSIELDATNTLRDLVHDGFDFGIRIGPQADADFVARPLWKGQFGLFAARPFIARGLRGRARITREMLERVPCIVLRPSAVWRFRDRDGQLTEIRPRPDFSVNDPRAAVDVARSGLGVVLAPLEAVPEDSELVRLKTDFGEPQDAELFIVYPTRRLLPLRVRAAIEWLAKSP